VEWWDEQGKGRLLRRFRGWGVVLWILLAMPAGVAWGQDNAESFEALVAEGVKAFSDGEYDKAIDRFTRARVIEDQPELLFNIARCYDRKGSCQAARDNYLTYIKRDGAAPDTVKRAKDLLEKLGECPTTGTVRLLCDPKSATATVTPNDAKIKLTPDQQDGPCGDRELPEGSYFISVSADGYKPVDRTVEIAVSKVELVRVNLEPSAATPPPPTNNNADSGGGINWLGWSLVGGGTVLFIAAIGVDVANQGVKDDLEQTPTTDPGRSDLESEFETNQALIWALGGIGIAAAVTGTVFLITGVGSSSSDEGSASMDDAWSWELSPTVSPDGDMGAVFRMTF